MKAVQHGKSKVSGVAVSEYLNPDYELNVSPIRVGSYNAEGWPIWFDVMSGEACRWYPDDALTAWTQRMEAEYGSKEQW